MCAISGERLSSAIPIIIILSNPDLRPSGVGFQSNPIQDHQMQQHPSSAVQLRNKLMPAVEEKYHVTNPIPRLSVLIPIPQQSSSHSTGRGRKRKRKPVTMEDKLADVTSLLKGQIANANEFRIQYQDRLARNEFQFQESVSAEEDAETNSSLNSVFVDVTDAAPVVASASTIKYPKLSAKKVKSSARRKKNELNTADEVPETEDIRRVETEAEILSKLPPIDEDILAEFANYVYEASEPVVDGPRVPANANDLTNSTEGINNLIRTTGDTTQVKTNSETRNKLFDFGDSDDEDEDDFIEVKTPEDISLRLSEMETSTSGAITPTAPVELEVVPAREIDESEVTRLHEEQIQNLNGNFDKAGTFREWHETVVVESYGKDASDDLLIFPYCVIDF